MPRHKLKSASRDAADAARRADEFATSGRSAGFRRPKPAGISESRLGRATKDLDGYSKSGDWSEARPLHFVALYVYLHECVYGVAPVMSSVDRKQAALVAGNCLKRQFEDDPGALADFMLWTWRKENETRQWRRKNGRTSTFRISWRYMFSGGNLITDYLVATREHDK